MPSTALTSWIALFAAFGLGTIIAGVLSRWSAISNLRQNWINALRDDLATYLVEIDAMHFESLATNHLERRKAALWVYRRILLRLNIDERPHKQLAESLKQLLNIGDSTEDDKRIDDVVTLARQILKQEWAVTKWGFFAKTIAASREQ